MNRKKWTKKSEIEITNELLIEREKKKWQLNFRRYVIEKQACPNYAPYFGLSIELLRKWFEIQFKDDLNWENFGEKWQFTHNIPMYFFDFFEQKDLKICWHFLNIRINANKSHLLESISLLENLKHFQELHKQFQIPILIQFINKIKKIIALQQSTLFEDSQINFLKNNHVFLKDAENFTQEDFLRLNSEISFEDIILEKKMLKKFF